MGGIMGGGSKKAAPPPPKPVEPPAPTGVTRAEQLAASKLRSRSSSGRRSLIGGTTLGPTEEIVNQDQSNRLGG